MNTKKVILTFLAILAVHFLLGQQVDPSFESPTLLSGPIIYDVKAQPEGKTLFCGEVAMADGVRQFGIVRTNTDGSLDPTFQFNPGCNGVVDKVEIQVNGHILVHFRKTLPIDSELNIPDGIYLLASDGTILKVLDDLGKGGYANVMKSDPDNKIYVVYQRSIIRYNAEGSVDNTFSGLDLTNGLMTAVEIQDDKIIIGGGFTEVKGIARNRLARLNQDGTLDETFDALGSHPYPSNWFDIEVQSDGKILVAGFIRYNGNLVPPLTRLNSDGTVDETFHLTTGPRFLVGDATHIHVSGDKIAFSASVTDYENPTNKSVTLRISSDGTIDGTLTPIEVTTILVNDFAIANGDLVFINQYPSETSAIIKYSNTGSFVPEYDPKIFMFGKINAMDFTENNDLIIGGDFVSVNGLKAHYLAKLSSSGELDTQFQNDFLTTPVTDLDYDQGDIYVTNNQDLYKLDLQCKVVDDFDYIGTTSKPVDKFHLLPDGKMWATTRVGVFSKLLADGTMDDTYNAGGSGIGSPWSTAYSFDFQSSGKPILGSTFTKYNGVVANHLVRINLDGSFDETFNIGTGPDEQVDLIRVLSSDEILIGGPFQEVNGVSAPHHLAKLSVDGALDGTFISNFTFDEMSPYSIFSDVDEYLDQLIITSPTKILKVDKTTGVNLDEFIMPGQFLIPRMDQFRISAANEFFVTGQFYPDGTVETHLIKLLPEEAHTVTSAEGKQYDEQEIRIYPNPTAELITIEDSGAVVNSTRTVSVIDTSGRKLTKLLWEGSTSLEMNFSNEHAGLYLILIDNGRGRRSMHKVIKQ